MRQSDKRLMFTLGTFGLGFMLLMLALALATGAWLGFLTVSAVVIGIPIVLWILSRVDRLAHRVFPDEGSRDGS